MINQAELKRLFFYDQKTGIFTNRTTRGSAKKRERSGYVKGNGYIAITIGYKTYYAHRLAWLYIHGYFPENPIDHVNRKRFDNRIKNLREVSMACNIRNSSTKSNNKSGVTGVHRHNQINAWVVQIMNFGKRHHIGCFNDLTEAVAYRLAAEQALSVNGCNDSSDAYLHMKNFCRKVAKAG